MGRRILIGLLLGLALVPPKAAGQPTPAQGRYREQLDNDAGFRLFLERLQRAIRDNEREAVLRMINYPLRVTVPNASDTYRRSRFYRTPAAVRADYGRIFTPSVCRTILAQRYEMLWGNWQGFMIGNGTVWFDRMCPHGSCQPPGPVRIVTVNP